MKYPIHEMFLTFQGEGSFAGLPAFFVRTFGCPVHCTFCDAAGTWHPDWVPDDVQKLAAEEIALAVTESGASRIVVTGGEPCIFDLRPLTSQFIFDEQEVHLETSGAYPIQGIFDWIVLSPKKAKDPIRQAVEIANEFKFIIEQPEDIGFFVRQLFGTGGTKLDDTRTIWLHPEWSQRENKEVLQAISEQVKKGKGTFRAGWQLHKLYGIDLLDPRTRKLVPLGGDINKGY